jgi:glycosyltransferase involved in cell wall biosynthesis
MSLVRRNLSIVKVWDADYPWDVRTEKVCRALTEAGHDVHLVARNNSRRPTVERLPEATVHRLAPLRAVPRRLNTASMFPAFFNPRWLRAIERVARANRADLIICRDLPLAIAAIRIARRLGIPMVLDMAENYPAMLRSQWGTGRMGLMDLFVRNPTVARQVERWVLPRVDGVMVVIEESGERLEWEGVPRERLAVVGNTPPRGRLQDAAATHAAGPLEVVYLGLLELNRGLATLLDAMAHLAQQHAAARLTVIGDGVDGDAVREHANRLGLTPRTVVFRGRVPNAEALSALPKAHVGVVPHWKDPNWDTTIPNKLFDYMAAGLAVVTSNAAPAARVVTRVGCGYVHQDRDPRDLARVLGILGDPAIRRSAAARGRNAIRTEYYWERDVERMLDLIQATVARHATSRSSFRASPEPPTRQPAYPAAV